MTPERSPDRPFGQHENPDRLRHRRDKPRGLGRRAGDNSVRSKDQPCPEEWVIGGKRSLITALDAARRDPLSADLAVGDLVTVCELLATARAAAPVRVVDATEGPYLNDHRVRSPCPSFSHARKTTRAPPAEADEALKVASCFRRGGCKDERWTTHRRSYPVARTLTRLARNPATGSKRRLARQRGKRTRAKERRTAPKRTGASTRVKGRKAWVVLKGCLAGEGVAKRVSAEQAPKPRPGKDAQGSERVQGCTAGQEARSETYASTGSSETMGGMLRRIFRPVYGERFHVRPKHWWNPRQRKTARIAAKLADHHADGVINARNTLLIYGHLLPPS